MCIITELRAKRAKLTPAEKTLNKMRNLFTKGVNNAVPETLARELIDNLDVDWSNPNLKFLDVKSNTGIFGLLLTEKLLQYGHTIDHILDNMIFMIDSSRTYVIISDATLKRAYNRGGNVIHGDFLTYEFGMKFDVIIGNPPYQDSTNKAKNYKLWHKFIKMSITDILNPNGTIGMVTPSSIFNTAVGFGKWFKEIVKSDFSLTSAVIHKEVKFFNVGVETCHWSITSSKVASINFPAIRDPIIDQIIGKILFSSEFLNLEFENPEITKKDLGHGTNEVFYSGKNKTCTNKKLFNGGLKIVYPFSASYASQFITDQPTCHFNKVFYVRDINQAENIMSWTNSELMNFYARYYNKTAGFTPVIKNKNLLPKLDDSKFWTNEDVYHYFKINDDEINFIKNNLK